MVGFGVEPRWLVAGCELGRGEAIALGAGQAHGVFLGVVGVVGV